jgi:hypothetical protein
VVHVCFGKYVSSFMYTLLTSVTRISFTAGKVNFQSLGRGERENFLTDLSSSCLRPFSLFFIEYLGKKNNFRKCLIFGINTWYIFFFIQFEFFQSREVSSIPDLSLPLAGGHASRHSIMEPSVVN